MNEGNSFFPKIKRSLSDFLTEEDGVMPRKKAIAIGALVVVMSMMYLPLEASAHRSHSSHKSHSSHSSGRGGHESHESHISHVSHTSSSGHSSTAHSNHGSHSNHSNAHNSHSSSVHSSSVVAHSSQPNISISEPLPNISEIPVPQLPQDTPQLDFNKELPLYMPNIDEK